jgi:beta-glucosidase
MKKLILVCTLILIYFYLPAQSIQNTLDGLIEEMTTEEKIYQLRNNTFFTTGDNTRLNIPGFQMSDGPHGVRFGGATSFPVGIAMAATWDTDLINRVGTAMGEEFWAHGKHQQLGPCIDLCRDPRNGRSPETSGEDPYLSGEIAKAVITGIQQTPVIATVKHYNLVNRQQYRENSDITISDRWLMEHYGNGFRMAVQEGGVQSVMNAYNLINGVHCSENEQLLQTILRERWGFPFYVVSDWGAVHDTEKALEAGTDICMGSDHYKNYLPGLVSSGAVSETSLNNAVRKVLRTKMLAGMLDNYPKAPTGLINSEEHQLLALEAANKVLVLLKNQDNILPLDSGSISKIALIGPSAAKAQLDGFGSSWVDTIYAVSPQQGIENLLGSSRVDYVYGCDINSLDTSGFSIARNAALSADVVIFVGGLDDTQEGEGYGGRPEYDRVGGSIDLPGKQQDLINELAKVNENIIVVLESGGICAINKSIDNIKGLIYAFYPGQEGGNAIAETLFGMSNPGGKLPVTMPKNDAQMPDWNDNFNDDYGCGYRWYDEMDLTPEFAFGFGLSYTSFLYSNIEVSATQVEVGSPVSISFDLTNTGSVAGEEVVQMYITDDAASLWMPEKQLKGFQRIKLNAGETKNISLELTAEDFYYWDETNDQYAIETGIFSAMVGGSSDNLPLQSSFELISGTDKPDFKITQLLSWPRYPVEKDTVSLMALVKNMGTKAITPGDEVEVAFKVNGEKIGSASYSNLSIPVGGMVSLEMNVGLWVALETDTNVITAIADPENNISETIESNNEFIKSIWVTDSLNAALSENIALNKPTSATSTEANNLGPENAVDGSLSTRWSSDFFDPQSFTIDLYGLYDLSKIRIQWESAYSNVFDISSSTDSISWVLLVSETQGDGNVDEFDVDNEARYIRFDGLSRATTYGHSFYEFEVYGALLEDYSPSTTTIINDAANPNYFDQISIYPNPVSNLLFFSGVVESEHVSVNLYDDLGTLQKTTILAKEQPLELSGMETGIYFLQLVGPTGTKTFRIVKE